MSLGDAEPSPESRPSHVGGAGTPPLSVTPAETDADFAEARRLCWDYRDFLLGNSAIDRDITETFYPVEKYQDLMAQLPQIHARPSGIILLARDAEESVLGCGMIHPLDPQTAEIKRLFVPEAGRRRGVARALCEALMSHARQQGYERTVLDTSRTLAAAQCLYRALGFRARGPYQPVPDDMLPHLLFFEKEL